MRITILLLLQLWLLTVPLAQAEQEKLEQYLPVDSDNDGVVDDQDECYKTTAGAVVDERGCYLLVTDTQSVRLNINFAFDSSVVKPDYFSEIEPIAEFMQQYPLTRVIIEGHSDSDGPAAYNKNLSQRRAQAVARVLVERYNITAQRVTAIGFGEERPLVANDTPTNKFKNRRVVAVIFATEEKRAQ